METSFQDMVDDLGNKKDIVNDFEKDMKTLSHIEIFFLKTNFCRLEESNTYLANEFSHLQAFVDELREEASPLQENNNHLFDEYKELKEYYDAIFFQLNEKDETIKGFQECQNNLEYQVHQLQNIENIEKKIVVVELLGSPIPSSTLTNFDCSLVFCENIVIFEMSGSPICSPPPDTLCKKDVVDLCVKNNDCVVSPRFEKHTIDIGCRLLIKVGYSTGGIGKNGHGIDVPITSNMKLLRMGLRYENGVLSFPTPSPTMIRKVLFVASGV
jgi:hypothetical protein